MHFVHKKNEIDYFTIFGMVNCEMILIAFAYTFFNKYILKDNREFMDILPEPFFLSRCPFIPYLVSYCILH